MKVTRLLAIFTLLITSNISFANQFNVLLFTKTAGWHHKSINAGVTAFEKMAKNHHFAVDWQEDARLINAENLAKFDVVVFLQTTADILNDEQQEALRKYVQSGKGFVGIHAAADTEYSWPWYGKLVGRRFVIHPVIQTARLNIINRKFPGLEYFPDSVLWTEEWYEYGPEESENLNYIMSVDESTFETKADWGHAKGDGMGDFHPISWYQEIEGGRSFYTGLGHMPATYDNKAFIEHIFGGLYWAATGKGLSNTKLHQ